MPKDEQRAAVVAFGPAYNLFTSTYLVPAGSPIQVISDVDQAGVVVGVVLNTTTGRSASQQLTIARVQTYGSVDELRESLVKSETHAIALSETSLRNLSKSIPGSRLLAGGFHSTSNAVAVPLGRPNLLAFVSTFVENAKRTGLVAKAFNSVGLSDAAVAP